MNVFGNSENVKDFVKSKTGTEPETAFPLYWSEEKDSYSWVANTFDRDIPEHIRLVPLAHGDLWLTIGDLVARYNPRQLLGVFAPFLQIDDPFDRAILALGMNTFCLAEERIQIGVATIEQLEIGGIVLTQPALAETLERVQDRSLPMLPYFQVVLGPKERPENMNKFFRVYYEIHLVPGLIGLFQCEYLAGSSDTFHLNHDFVWEYVDQALLVTDIRRRRFVRARFPQIVLAKESACSCGHTMCVMLQ